MNDDRTERLKTILTEARQRQGAARVTYLAESCQGDEEMRKRLEQMIADDFLETPVFRVRAALSEEAMLGRRFGPYRLVRSIGQGGMGTVFLAEREDGEFTRQAAVKVVRGGFDSEEALWRFRRERQILASLAHPNIAMLLDGGATADGLPYIVMEYIDGQAIDEWIQSRSLSLPQRLRLYCGICSAVEHAHRNLIVHGDIKPANILVTAEGIPKLLDFGIARLVEHEDDTETLVAWTPKFASPEQLRGEPINTISDVYSLGVLLAEISGPAAEAGDLKAIVQKATQTERRERYSSVHALSADILRYLDRRPVLAHPATPWYRIRKFVRRRPWAVAFAFLFLASLSWKITADQIQAGVLRAERDRANRRFQDVRALANSLIFDVERDIARLRGGTAVRAKLVSRALGYLDALARESAGDLALQSDIADAYAKLGDVQGRSGSSNLGQTDRAAESYRKAIALRESLSRAVPNNQDWQESLATAYSRYAGVLQDMGEFVRGLEFERKALRIREALLAANPSAERERIVAQNYTTLGAGLAQVGDWDSVLDTRRRALAMYQRIVARDPTNRSDRRGLALAESRLGGILLRQRDLRASAEHYREALRIETALANENPANAQIRMSLASAYVALAGALHESSDYAAASANYASALRIQEEIVAADPADARSGSLLSTTLQRMSVNLAKAGKAAQAWPYAERCLKLRRTLAAANPANAGARGDLATALATAGQVRAAMADRTGAREFYAQSVSLYAELEKTGHASANLRDEARGASAALALLGSPAH